MAFRRATVLALAVRLSLAAPGGLRGLGASAPLDAAPAAAEAEEELVEQRSANATPSTTGAALLSVAEQQAANISEASAPGTGSGAHALRPPANVSEASDADADYMVLKKYWDGQCTPCPANSYPHCWAGGVLAWVRPCGPDGAGCEGQCLYEVRPGQPTEVVRQGVMTLYHTTSPEIAEKILAGGFRPGNIGWCGGAIYFYASPDVPHSKLTGANSHQGAVIEARVDMGRMALMDPKCDGGEEALGTWDSLKFNPGDGDEYVIASKSRVISTRRYR